jgi:hypothetical protein
MVAVAAITGRTLRIKVCDGATPTEVFTEDCWINTERGIEFASDVTSVLVPDCDDVDEAGWNQITKDGLNATITGAGVMHTESTEDWYEWYTLDLAKNLQIMVDTPAASGGGHWAGAFKLTGFTVTGPSSDLSTTDNTLMSHGPVVWVPAV